MSRSGDRSCADLPRSAWSSLAHGSADDRKSRVRAAISASGLRHVLVSGARLPLVTDDIVAAARTFLDRDGRLIERRLAAVLFDDAPVSGVVDAVRAYRNPDGGFGHGLEPDKRCPASLPIDVERALDILLVATGDAGEDGPGNLDLSGLVEDACDWLASVAAPDGAVSLALPVMERYPRAEHWADWTYVPGLNPTAGLAGRLHQTGVTHPWLDRATEWTWGRLSSGFDEDAHALIEVLVFLDQVPDRDRAGAVGAHVDEWLTQAEWYRADPADPGYGLTPLHVAPSPDSTWRRLFDDTVIDRHLDRLASDQQADGGWSITWEPPGAASMLEWRGIETLRALRILRAYGRL